MHTKDKNLPSLFTLIYLPGMQGQIPPDRWFVKGLKRAGLKNSQIFDWPKSKWPINNLRDRNQHSSAAQQLIKQTTQIKTDQPDQQVILIGHSTGAMIILDALENIQPDIITQAWLLAAAVSSDYDITPGLKNLNHLVNIHSPLDWLTLNLGTKLFGTADGKRASAAGHTGFIGPGHDNEKLIQWKYDTKWLKKGHYGGHLGPLGSPFARKVIAPAIINLHNTGKIK